MIRPEAVNRRNVRKLLKPEANENQAALQCP